LAVQLKTWNNGLRRRFKLSVVSTAYLAPLAQGKSPMRISDAAKQAIDIQAKTMQTQQAIAAAVLKKQAEVDKSSAQSIVQLLESAASPPSRGLDLKA
jgi:hypothetical protein